MARITVTLPDSLHKQILKLAGKENDSISYTVTKLVEIGLLVMNNKNKDNGNHCGSELEEYCQKLIIQINGIIKELAIDQFNFDHKKISQITSETLIKFNKLKEANKSME